MFGWLLGSKQCKAQGLQREIIGDLDHPLITAAVVECFDEADEVVSRFSVYLYCEGAEKIDLDAYLRRETRHTAHVRQVITACFTSAQAQSLVLQSSQ